MTVARITSTRIWGSRFSFHLSSIKWRETDMTPQIILVLRQTTKSLQPVQNDGTWKQTPYDDDKLCVSDSFYMMRFAERGDIPYGAA
jgi:hypothetical protein